VNLFSPRRYAATVYLFSSSILRDLPPRSEVDAAHSYVVHDPLSTVDVFSCHCLRTDRSQKLSLVSRFLSAVGGLLFSASPCASLRHVVTVPTFFEFSLFCIRTAPRIGRVATLLLPSHDDSSLSV